MSSTFTSTTSGIALTLASQNPATIVSGAYVTNTTGSFAGDALYGNTAAAWNISNFGTLKATLAGANGIDLKAGGSVTNASTARIIGVATGVKITGTIGGSVSNFGTINGSTGVYLQAGGNVLNGA